KQTDRWKVLRTAAHSQSIDPSQWFDGPT
ncbi:unnamed protein product, partial [Rotaria magnacalcarata]